MRRLQASLLGPGCFMKGGGFTFSWPSLVKLHQPLLDIPGAVPCPGRGDDAVGNPDRAQISQFELFELSSLVVVVVVGGGGSGIIIIIISSSSSSLSSIISCSSSIVIIIIISVSISMSNYYCCSLQDLASMRGAPGRPNAAGLGRPAIT